MSSGGKKKIKPGDIKIHPTEDALLIDCIIEIMTSDSTIERRAQQKKIAVDELQKGQDLARKAIDIMNSCKLIHPSKLDVVQSLLQYMIDRKEHGSVGKPASRNLRSEIDRLDQDSRGNGNLFPGLTAVIENIDDYVEMLYEELPEKIKGTYLILRLCQSPDYIPSIIANESLLSAISRVLLEDGKKSMDLTTNIVSIWFTFSMFSNFHPILEQMKIHENCMKIIEYELLRTKTLEDEKKKTESDNISSSIFVRQSKLIYYALHLLINLCEDLNIELHLVKRNLIRNIVQVMKYQNSDLRILCLDYLRKLAIFKENKNIILKHIDTIFNVVDEIISKEEKDIQAIISAVKALLNMSHEPEFRLLISRRGLIPKICNLVDLPISKEPIFCLLFLLSIDDRAKSVFIYTNIAPMMMKMILESSVEKIPFEMLGFAINITTNDQIGEIICANAGLKFLIRKATKTRNMFLWKMINNISLHEGTKAYFLDYIDDLMEMLIRDCPNDIIPELLGILGNINLPNFDFSKLINEHKLVPYIKSIAKSPETLEDDIALNLIILFGSFLEDENTVKIVTEKSFLKLILDILMAKQDDDEIVLQTIYVIYKILGHPNGRKYLLRNEEFDVISFLIDLLYDQNEEIQRLCDTCLNIISESDNEWHEKIKDLRFRWHNKEWIECLENPEDADLGDEFINTTEEEKSQHFQSYMIESPN